MREGETMDASPEGPNEDEILESEAYDLLRFVLEQAYDQAAKGKGKERHANGRSFNEQPMQKLIDIYGLGFSLGQAGKKAQEAMRMEYPAARRELLGAIVYIAGSIVALDRAHSDGEG